VGHDGRERAWLLQVERHQQLVVRTERDVSLRIQKVQWQRSIKLVELDEKLRILTISFLTR
jgi:hypothetical protein